MKILVSLMLLIAGIAMASHHEQDACPNGHVGNCVGPNDVQNAVFQLGPFLAGVDTEFWVALYWKLPPTFGPGQDRTCQIVYEFAADAPIWLAIGDTFIPNPNNAELALAMDRTPGGTAGFVTPYQHTRFDLPNGTAECPTCNKKLGLWLVKSLYSSDPGPMFPPAMGNDLQHPDQPIGWMRFVIKSPQEGTYTLSLNKGWVKSNVPGRFNCFLTGYAMENFGDEQVPQRVGSDGPEVWTILPGDAATFVLTVVNELPPAPKVPSLSTLGLIALTTLMIVVVSTPFAIASLVPKYKKE